MTQLPPDDDLPDDDDGADDASDDFLREIARVDERPPPTPADRVRLEGTNIGRFKVISEIGRGGMGIVFLAEDEKLRRKVALKLLPPSFAADEERVRRFLREARAAAAVSHPNLVTVYDVGEHEGRGYIAMEYLRGESLRDRLYDRPLSVDEAVEMARQVLAGLTHAHAAGLLHRDLKPENVLVERDGRVRVVDFGLAKLDGDIEMPGDNPTRDGLVLGTPGYMSPEQARGQAVDARSDIFSFGVMLFEMLLRKRPFTGPTRADIVTSLLRDAAPRVDEQRPEVGAALADVVARCLAKAPDDRYPSTVALGEALEDAWTLPKRESKRELPLVVSTPGSGSAAAPSTRTTGPVAPGASGAPGAAPRKRIMGWVLRGAAVCAAIALAFTMHASREAAVTATSASTADAGTNGANAKKGLAITDVPLPSSRSPDALASYRQALQAIRDADWAIAEDRLADALKYDPELSSAHLRLAILGGTDDALRAREELSRAMTTRSRLPERDQALMTAMEPRLSREPAETELARQRLRELAQSHPDDAELWHYFAIFGVEGTDEGIAASRHAVALDPQFADAWQILASQLARRGQTEEALATIERCVTMAPLSADCRGERARFYGMQGDCSRMADDLQHGLTSNPRAATVWHEDRAAALVATGRSDDTVLEAFQQKWALASESRRKGVEGRDRALLATARGHFAEAEALLAEGEKAIAGDPDVQIHGQYANLKLSILLETGRLKEAAKLAQRVLAKKDVWIGSTSSDLEMPMLRVMQHGGLLTAAEFGERRDAWNERSRTSELGRMKIATWALSELLATPAEAKDALDTFEALPEDQKDMCFRAHEENHTRAEIGYAMLLAGRAEEALPQLEVGTNACNWLHWAIEHTRSLLHLGQAHEKLGHTENACEAYQRVVARWSTADKTSTTLALAKARVKALSCGNDARRASAMRRTSADASLPDSRMAMNEPDSDDDEDPPSHAAPPPPEPPPPAPPAPPVVAVPGNLTAIPGWLQPHIDIQNAKTKTRVAVLHGKERDPTCEKAKQTAITNAGCKKARSVEGTCDCHAGNEEWICAAVMAVTCN